MNRLQKSGALRIPKSITAWVYKQEAHNRIRVSHSVKPA